ncbi:MAG: dihydroorotase family protein [Treponema sp.]|nr:dihydroorotase family protein [Treponema sp.]
MHYDLILRNGTLVTPEKSFKADVAVKNGKIIFSGVLENTDTADDEYDAGGKYILPGVIDAHVHFRDPGLTEKEDFESGSMAAAFGGITTIADMPNVIPPTSTVERFNEKARLAKEKSYIDFCLFSLLSNENTNEMDGLKKAGTLGFKIFLGTSTGDIASPSEGVLIEQMMAAAGLGMRIGFHAETSGLNSHFTSLCKKINDVPEGLLLSSARPVISEVLAIQTAIIYSQFTKTKIHIHHVTSGEGAALIGEAKLKGINVTAETCPHYLLLDAENGTNKVYPPIRDKEQQKGLWEAVEKRIIDMIASDHAPHTKKEKSLSLWEMPAGLCGVETFVPVMLNEVNKKTLTLNDFARLSSEAPAKIWGIYPQKGNLQNGADADFTIVDMNKKYRIDKNALHSKSKTSPFDGMEIKGMLAATIVRGKFILKDGCLTGKKGFGSLVSPAL